jgi:hypothetical protein
VVEDVLRVTYALEGALFGTVDAAPGDLIGRSKLDTVSAEKVVLEIVGVRAGGLWVIPSYAKARVNLGLSMI